MHFLYIYNWELIRNLEGTVRKIQVHFYKDLIRKLGGMHQEEPIASSMYLYKDSIRKLEGMHQEDPDAFSVYILVMI